MGKFISITRWKNKKKKCAWFYRNGSENDFVTFDRIMCIIFCCFVL